MLSGEFEQSYKKKVDSREKEDATETEEQREKGPEEPMDTLHPIEDKADSLVKENAIGTEEKQSENAGPMETEEMVLSERNESVPDNEEDSAERITDERPKSPTDKPSEDEETGGNKKVEEKKVASDDESRPGEPMDTPQSVDDNAVSLEGKENATAGIEEEQQKEPVDGSLPVETEVGSLVMESVSENEEQREKEPIDGLESVQDEIDSLEMESATETAEQREKEPMNSSESVEDKAASLEMESATETEARKSTNIDSMEAEEIVLGNEVLPDDEDDSAERITDERPKSPTEKSNDNEDSGENNAGEAKKVTSETESDDESGKPQIFLRNFAEITEQQSDSEDDDLLHFNAIPSGIASSYQKTINELQDYSEDSSSSHNDSFVSRLHEIATYDVSKSDLELDCDMGAAQRIDRDVNRLAYKLKQWVVRKKNLQTEGSNQLTITASPIPASIPQPLPTLPPLPISISPCVRPAQVPVRWQPAVSINSTNKPTSGRPPIAPAQGPIVNPGSVRVGWQASVQRVLSRPNAPIMSTMPLQPVRASTVTSFASSPRLSTVTSNNAQQQQLTQLIFDPSMGQVLLCPTSQMSQQPQLNQNSRLPSPTNMQLHNGILVRPSADMSITSIPRSQNATRLQAPTPIIMQRLPPPTRPPPLGPLRPAPVQSYARPMNPRGIKPQQMQPVANHKQVGPLPGLAPIQSSHQIRNRMPVPAPVPIMPQPVARNNSPAPNPPVYPSPKVSSIPPVRQIQTPKSTTTVAPGTVGAGVTAGNQKPIPGTVDDADSDLQNKTFPSLVVHVKTILSNKPDRQAQGKARSELDASVKAVLVNTPAQFTEWLMRRGLLRLDHRCDTHRNQLFRLGMYSDVSRQPFSGGYVWTSECCPDKQISVYSGSIFEGSKYPPGTVLKLIYHWACQTPATNVLQWVKVSSLYLKNFFTLLRAVCISWLHEMCPPLGGEMKYVEIGVITLGSSAETSRGVKNVNVEILGVFDPATKIVRMKVINSMQGQLFKDKSKGGHANEQGARAFQILWPLTHWVDKRSILLVDGIIDKALFHELGFKNIQQCSENVKSPATNMNVMNYLRNLVPKMFSSTLSVLSKSIVQQFLDELSWREMYGQTVLQCYENIMDHIGTMTKWDHGSESLISRLNKVYQNPFVDWSNSKQLRRSPLNTIPVSLRNEPGIRECIRHVMKDDKNPNGTAFKTYQPPPAPVTANNKNNKMQSQQHSVAQKRKLAENTLSSNLSFYKSHAARHPKQISLQQYYYGTLVGNEEICNADIVPLPPNLKCPLCVRTFSTSVEIIRHLYVHVGSILSRGNENSICSTCLKDVPTGVTVTQHVNQVHKMTGIRYNCRICEEKFKTEDDMIFHMWDLHVPCEAPYKCLSCSFGSSFHFELIQHYQEKHSNSGSVMCPFCTKILPAYSLLHLKNVISHLQNHGSRRAKKCSRCVLTFAADIELDAHMVNHLPVTQGPAWTQYIPVQDEVILMAVPPISRTPLLLVPSSKHNSGTSTPPVKKAKISTSKKKNDAKSLNTSFAVPLDTNEKFGGSQFKINVPLVEKGRAICAECRKDVTEPNHFIGRLICSKCRYVTACESAMDLHHEKSHKPGVNGTIPGLSTKPVVMLNEPLVCKCGFTSLNPFKIARHMIKCEKLTVYPTNKIHIPPTPVENTVPPSLNPPPVENIPPPPPSSNSTSAAPRADPDPQSLSPSSLENMLTEPITTFEDMLSLDASMDTSFESLSLPPMLSPTSTMPQTPMPGLPFLSPNQHSNNNGNDSNSNNAIWQTEPWDLPPPISGITAKCGQPLR